MAINYPPTPEQIAANIATRWPAAVDYTRLNRALVLVHAHALEMARVDETGKPIPPSWEVLAIRGTSSNYIVRPGSCTCPDNAISHHICKHRIAAYIFRQLMEA